MIYFFAFLLSIISPQTQSAPPAEEVYLRVNQLGYLPEEPKLAIAFSKGKLKEKVLLKSTRDDSFAHKLKAAPLKGKSWGAFPFYYELDFSEVSQAGTYYLETASGSARSAEFEIGEHAYGHHQEDLLEFMRQQRCGYNPFLDLVCHQRDGRSMYGPMPDSTYVDLSGGWHDAGDQLKYLMTSSYATAHMLKAYELYPDKFGDTHNALGQPGANGIPDVLDEAKWGLDWLLRMHPEPEVLFHQVADDRDHRGWKMPDEDISEYGWGPNSYRVGYVANGQPQGLGGYLSKATGLANLAGRSAAAMAMAARIWKQNGYDPAFAARCQQAAQSLYALGKANEGYQQGNSYGAPYRYGEDTWADDMEWGAAELFRLTQQPHLITEAKRYARLANTVSWMPLDTAEHYRYYPFVNMGHHALYELVDPAFQDTLASYYREGIEHTVSRAANTPYTIGVPFIWCSNNLLTGLIMQILLYEDMTGDGQYQAFAVQQRDWLFGRNPWGTSMFTALPADGEYPLDVHTSVYVMTKRVVPGGLVDGPVYASIHQAQRGLEMVDGDEFAHLQNPYVVYHDDIGDYATNEPTMDGTAGALLMMAHWGMRAGTKK